ncbi:MAG: hypothetical protein ACTJLM_01595 [Ehrlichia sp.]
MKERYVDCISVDEYEAFGVLRTAGATCDSIIKEFADFVPIDALEKHFAFLYEDIMFSTFKNDKSRNYVTLAFYKIYMSFERCKKIEVIL